MKRMSDDGKLAVYPHLLAEVKERQSLQGWERQLLSSLPLTCKLSFSKSADFLLQTSDGWRLFLRPIAVCKNSHPWCDETSWRLAGKKHWIHPNRSQAAFEAGMGADYAGACHGDFYGVYTSFDGQGCWSHLFRDIAACIESPLPPEQEFGEVLMARLAAIWKTWREWKAGLVSEWTLENVARYLQRQLADWLVELPSDLPKRANRLKKRLLKQWKRVFYFLDHPGTPHLTYPNLLPDNT